MVGRQAMNRPLRSLLWLVVAAQALFAAGFAFEVDAALELMPFEGRG